MALVFVRVRNMLTMGAELYDLPGELHTQLMYFVNKGSRLTNVAFRDMKIHEGTLTREEREDIAGRWCQDHAKEFLVPVFAIRGAVQGL